MELCILLELSIYRSAGVPRGMSLTCKEREGGIVLVIKASFYCPQIFFLFIRHNELLKTLRHHRGFFVCITIIF